MTVAQADSTLDQIKQKVRRLVMAGDATALPDSEIERQINTFVEQDFPVSVRINEFIERREFYTTAGVDRYAIDLNEVRKVKEPVIVSGSFADYYQDYRTFERIYPKSYQRTTIAGDGTAGAYSTTVSSQNLLREEVVVSATLSTGDQEVFQDDGNGTLVSQTTGSTGTGTVDYATALITVTFDNTVNTGDEISIQYVEITLDQPKSAFFRNNEMILRPVPDQVYKVQYDAFIVPSAFIANNQTPQVNFWWEYIAYGAAKKILEDRQDTESLAVILPTFNEKESKIVEQTASQDSNMRAGTIYVDPIQGYGGAYRDGVY